VALAFEQQGGDGAVDSTGHGDEDFFGFGHASRRRDWSGWFVNR
jgi:hypothetical protein